MAESIGISLTLDLIAAELTTQLPEMIPQPDNAVISRFLNLAFFASLEREEGLPVTFALALVDDKMLKGHGENPQHWRVIEFHESRPATPSSIAKLAGASDNRQTSIAISSVDGELRISGLIRTNKEYFRMLLGQTSSAGFAQTQSLIACVTDTGTIEIDVGVDHFATISRGELIKNGVNVFSGGTIFTLLSESAQRGSLNFDQYCGLLQLTIYNLSNRGHGGTVVLLPEIDEGDSSHFNCNFKIDCPSLALQDIVRFCSGEDLGATCTIDIFHVDNPPSEEEIKINHARARAVREHEFMRDGAQFAADLASVDGALVLDSELRIVGFGVHLLYSEPQTVYVSKTLKLDGADGVTDTLREMGTRHNSAARWCYHNPGSVAFVVSQDGIISCFYREDSDSQLLMWRPVKLNAH